MRGIFVVLVLALFVLAACGGPKVPRESMDTFAKCLTEQGAIMYGAFWCPHCAKTKKKFGSSFQYIKYVECDPRGDNEQSEFCIQKGIDKYDTWDFANGERVVAEPSFEILSKHTGCEVPR